MNKLLDFKIKEMFSAYENIFGDGHYQYYCGRCFQRFATDWNIVANAINPYINRGGFVRCPYCGTLHDKYIGYGQTNEYIPFEMRFRVIAYKKAIVLKIDYEATKFINNIFARKWCKGREIFTFDIEKGCSTFSVTINVEGSGNEYATYPINSKYAMAILNGSILRFFQSNCLARKTHKSDLISALRILREHTANIIKKEKGIKLGTTYINALGHNAGMFLLPLLNLAQKLKCPDSENLTSESKFNSIINEVYTVNPSSGLPENWVEVLVELAEQGMDITTAMVRSVGLPERDSVKKIIAQDYHNITNLKTAFNLCQNHDLGLRLYEAIIINDDMEKFFKDIIPIYGEDGIVRFAENAKEYDLKDCIRLYNQLENENKEILRAKRIRLRELHDWLAIVHKRQRHVNIPLNVPEHIVRRLSMQTNSLKFFVPKESIELLEAGHMLHNCVAGYSEDMSQGRLYIVVVTDDKGKYQACLEIKGNKIVQAKIDRNRSVKLDRMVNKVVLDWAKERKLDINTSDIEIFKETTKIKIA